MEIKNQICKQIWEDRYKKNNETVTQNIERVSKFCSNTDEEAIKFNNIMQQGYFLPAGRTMSNAGIGNKLTLNNCFVLNSVEDDMEQIFETVKIGALTHKAGGGTGYDFSRIRPEGCSTSNDAIASGATSFMNVFDYETATINQGSRRGANMGTSNIYYYDIVKFINAKSHNAETLKHFNLSVMIDDKFMDAKNNNEDIWLRYPVYDDYGHIIYDEDKWIMKQKINAKELWDLIIKTAYNTGEIGVLYYDNFNKFNNTSYTETIVCTNPCGEYCSGLIYNQELPSTDYKGACNLGSLFLHKFIKNPFTSQAYIDTDELKKSIRIGVRVLDNIIDKNYFPHEHYRNYQKNMRTIGLGITGLADALAMLGRTYGCNDEDLDFVDRLMNFITYNAYSTSLELAKEKGVFNFCDNEKISQSNFIQLHVDNYNTPSTNWELLQQEIKKYGLRNARIMSVAPTGTLSLTYGENCSSGIEPIFQLEYERKVRIGGQEEENEQIIQMRDYAYNIWVKNGEDKQFKHVWKTALDLPVDVHIDMLGTVAKHVDMSVSKTINIPTDYHFEDAKNVYDRCHKLGIKGCTIFRPNELRQGVLISKDKKEKNNATLQRGDILCVSDDLLSCKRTIINGCGKFYLHCDFDEFTGEPLETFIDIGSGGGCERNLQFISRLISLLLRAGVPVEEIIDQAMSIRPCKAYTDRTKSKGDTSKGTSCPSAIGYALKELQEKIHNRCFVDESESTAIEEINENNNLTDYKNICPECGEPLSLEGGCDVCHNCGFSHCG